MDKIAWLRVCAEGSAREFFKRDAQDAANRRELADEANQLGLDAADGLWPYFRSIVKQAEADDRSFDAHRFRRYLPGGE